MIKVYNKHYLKEASFSSESFEKVLKNIVSLIRKRTGFLFLPSQVPILIEREGKKYRTITYYSKDRALRFNWELGESLNNLTIDSVDFLFNFSSIPAYTLNLQGINIIQVLDVITNTIKTGIPYSESKKLKEMARPNRSIPSILKWIKINKIKLRDLAGIRIQDSYIKYIKWAERNRKILEVIPDLSLQTYRSAIMEIFSQKGIEYSFARVTPVRSKKEKKLVNKQKKEIFESKIDDVTKLTPEEIFAMMEFGLKQILSGRSNSLIVAGDPGVGKSYGVMKAVEESGRENILFKGKGAGTPVQLYTNLYRYNGQILIFDDNDAVFRDPDSIAILKGALDTPKERLITYSSRQLKTEEIPERFYFTGQIIFVTNLYISQLDSAIISRSNVVEIDLTNEEIIERIKSIMDLLPPTDVNLEIKEKTLELLLKLKKSYKKLDFRTFEQSVEILSSGNPFGEKWILELLKQKRKVAA